MTDLIFVIPPQNKIFSHFINFNKLKKDKLLPEFLTKMVPKLYLADFKKHLLGLGGNVNIQIDLNE